MASLNDDLYKELLSSIRLGSKAGEVSKAKPIALISIIESIRDDVSKGNKIYFDDVLPYYNVNRKKYPQCATSFSYPFYFLKSEYFYHLKWKGEAIKTKSPSMLKIRENVLYAYLDNALWDILQNESQRDSYVHLLENLYLNR